MVYPWYRVIKDDGDNVKPGLFGDAVAFDVIRGGIDYSFLFGYVHRLGRMHLVTGRAALDLHEDDKLAVFGDDIYLGASRSPVSVADGISVLSQVAAGQLLSQGAQ